MFVSLNKEDVHGLCKDGRDAPCGNVYINISHISHIDGADVIVGDWRITLTDKETGIHSSNIVANLKGRQTETKGISWCYVEDMSEKGR